MWFLLGVRVEVERSSTKVHLWVATLVVNMSSILSEHGESAEKAAINFLTQKKNITDFRAEAGFVN